MDYVKRAAKAWNSISLIKRILVGLCIGVILALLVPGIAAIELLGTLFVSALKAVAPILVFFLVISALANAKSSGAMGTVVALYVVSTFVAALVAVIASSIFPVNLELVVAAEDQAAPSDVATVLVTVITNAVANPVEALTNANYLGILLWAVLLGIALRIASDSTKEVFSSISNAVSTVVRWVISLEPFGILVLVYTSVGNN